jgi:hypothetical protein
MEHELLENYGIKIILPGQKLKKFMLKLMALGLKELNKNFYKKLGQSG